MRDGLFVFLICFWTLMAIMAGAFNVELSKSSVIDLQPGFNDENIPVLNQDSSIFDWLDQIPGINLLTPLLKIMFFQYTDQIPPAVSLLLDMTAIFTVFVVYTLIRSG